MTSGLRQAMLTLAALSVLGLVGYVATAVPDDLTAPEPGPAPITSHTLAFTSGPSDTGTAAVATTMGTTTSSTEVPTRPITIFLHPGEVKASIVVEDEEGEDGVEPGQQISVTGPATIEVQAEGYRVDTTEIDVHAQGEIDIYLDPPDQLVDLRSVFTTGSAPKQVAFTPDGSELWVTLLAGTGLEVYDPADGDLLDEIDLPEAGSVEVIFDPSGAKAYVSQMETATVYEIDVDSRRIERQLVTEGSWTKVVALSPEGDRLWASNWVSNDVSEFELESGEMVRRLETVTTPRGLALDPSGEKLYVAGYDSGDLEVIDLETGSRQVVHRTGGALRHLVSDPESGLIYASDMALDLILAIDTATDEVTEVATTDRLPNTIDLTPDGRILAVSNRGANNPETYYQPGPEWGTVLLLDTRTGEILDAVVGGNQPTGLDISADGQRLAFSDFLDNRVSVFDLPSSGDLLGGSGGRVATYAGEIAK